MQKSAPASRAAALTASSRSAFLAKDTAKGSTPSAISQRSSTTGSASSRDRRALNGLDRPRIGERGLHGAANGFRCEGTSRPKAPGAAPQHAQAEAPALAAPDRLQPFVARAKIILQGRAEPDVGVVGAALLRERRAQARRARAARLRGAGWRREARSAAKPGGASEAARS